jgi:hypothetical protein
MASTSLNVARTDVPSIRYSNLCADATIQGTLSRRTRSTLPWRGLVFMVLIGAALIGIGIALMSLDPAAPAGKAHPLAASIPRH